MSKHTQGPWTALQVEHYWQVSREHEYGATGICQVFHTDPAQMQANAALIAAAPDLLEALKGAFDWNQADIEGFDDITPSMEMLEARAEVIKAAIAKATV